ncbi:helix-turn-helix domain-containing protein [Nocardioides soli]|nr:helix-turn-helix domain-containing protein [Nocardioides soli]
MFEPDGPVEHAVVAAAEAFGTTPEDLLGADRSRAAADGRAVAMTAACIQGHSLPAIARHFDRDHTTVLQATRRIEKSPALNGLAAKIAAGLPEEIPDPAPASTFEPDGPVEHAVVAAAEAFGTTPEVLLGADRTRTASDARAVAMTAARIQGHSLPAIARHFDRDHTTVLHATRRIEKTPPLRDLAATIAADLPEQPSSSIGAGDVVEHVPERGHRSLGVREQERAIPGAGERDQLRVAR